MLVFYAFNSVSLCLCEPIAYSLSLLKCKNVHNYVLGVCTFTHIIPIRLGET